MHFNFPVTDRFAQVTVTADLANGGTVFGQVDYNSPDANVMSVQTQYAKNEAFTYASFTLFVY